MIRAVYRDGVIYPAEPVPPDWEEGQEVRVESGLDEPSDEPEDIDAWEAEWRAAGPLRYEAGEREKVQQLLDEADRLAKAYVRREMGLAD